MVQTEETTWWMDDATLRFAMDSMRLHGQTVLTVDAEALTVSPDEVYVQANCYDVTLPCCVIHERSSIRLHGAGFCCARAASVTMLAIA